MDHLCLADPRPATGRTLRKIRSDLDELKPTLGTADLIACLRESTDLEAPKDKSARVIYVITDGQRFGWRLDEFDVLVAATGFRIDLPFLSKDIAPTAQNRIRLWKRVISPEWPGLYFVGMMNVVSYSNLWAYERQVLWLRDFILGKAVPPSIEEMNRDNDAKDRYIAKEFKQTIRHTIEEDPVRYFPELKKALKAARRRAAQDTVAPAR